MIAIKRKQRMNVRNGKAYRKRETEFYRPKGSFREEKE